MFDTVLQNGRIVTPQGVVTGDIAMDQGKIAAIGDGLTGRHNMDASGKIILPGGVDPHAHIEQLSGMGVMNADTFETATRSAARGGTTSVISFAAQQQGERLSDRVADYSARAERGAVIDYAFHLSLSDVSAPDFDQDLADLIGQGHRSIKVFTTYNIQLNDHDILHVLARARALGALVCVHAENDGMISWARTALLKAGLSAPKYHAPSHPRLAEIEAVSRMCHYAEIMGTPVMLFHISARESLRIIAEAQARGVPVRAETCPHYLMMTDDALDRPGIEGAKWMCSPPQREAADQSALWEALRNGPLEIVSSDHAPYRFDETGKLSHGQDADFSRIANGLPGLQTRLPLLFDGMMTKGQGDLPLFARLTAQNPAEIYGLAGKGRLEVGYDADVALWDPDLTRRYGAADLADNVGYNPWEGREITGFPTHVWSRGTVIVDEGRLVGRPGQGRWMYRAAIGDDTVPPAREVQVIEGAR